MSETNDEGRVLRNCWTCGHKYEHGCAVMDEMTTHTPDEAHAVYQWGEAFDWTADGLPDADADNCPGWTPKADTETTTEPTPKKRPRKSRPCQTEGCERIASGGAKHCRTCRAERPLRQEIAELEASHTRVSEDWSRVQGCVDASHVILDSANVSREHHMGGWRSLECRIESLVANRDVWQAFAMQYETERDSALTTVAQLNQQVGDLAIERDDLQNALNVAQDHARGQKVRLERAKAERDEMHEAVARLQKERADLHAERDAARKDAKDAHNDFLRLSDGMDTLEEQRNTARDGLQKSEATAGRLRTRLHIMYAVAGLLAVAVVVGGVL